MQRSVERVGTVSYILLLQENSSEDPADKIYAAPKTRRLIHLHAYPPPPRFIGSKPYLMLLGIQTQVIEDLVKHHPDQRDIDHVSIQTALVVRNRKDQLALMAVLGGEGVDAQVYCA